MSAIIQKLVSIELHFKSLYGFYMIGKLVPIWLNFKKLKQDASHQRYLMIRYFLNSAITNYIYLITQKVSFMFLSNVSKLGSSKGNFCSVFFRFLLCLYLQIPTTLLNSLAFSESMLVQCQILIKIFELRVKLQSSFNNNNVIL